MIEEFESQLPSTSERISTKIYIRSTKYIISAVHFRINCNWSKIDFLPILGVMFKKRAGKGNGNIRRVESAEKNEPEDIVDLNAVTELKLEQSQRKRNRGYVIDGIELELRKKTDYQKDGDKPARTIESMIGNQFSVRADNGLNGGMDHEKIMEKYVKDKLGITALEQQKSVQLPIFAQSCSLFYL